MHDFNKAAALIVTLGILGMCMPSHAGDIETGLDTDSKTNVYVRPGDGTTGYSVDGKTQLVFPGNGKQGFTPDGKLVTVTPGYEREEEPQTPPQSTQAAPSAQGIIAGGYELVYIPAGEFWMGSPDGEGESDERPRHKVYLDGYYIGKYEVTVAQYRKFCNATGRTMPGQPDLNGHDNPVVGVSWDDAKSYSEWAGMRLPTEAEWEKAARGGTDTKYWWGNSESHDYANYDGTGGLDRWSGMGPAGSFPSNGYGLYDTSGNVWEWCADWYGGGYYGSSPANNPAGPTHGSFRVLRGGSWYNAPSGVSSANRNRSDPGGRDPNDGFRCAK